LTLTNVNSALVISTLMVIGTAAMYYIGTLHVVAGTLTLGSLLVFSAYLLMLYQPLESLTYTAWAMEGATAGAKRCFEVLDRQDIRQITKKTLRAQIAIVLQDTLLFSTTVRENIAYGQLGATDDEIIEAARKAQADEFIRQMPQRYASPVGERGGHLSVGQ